ncbi:MAG: ABC transporter substrate-binding protein [Halobacteria archaeon]
MQDILGRRGFLKKTGVSAAGLTVGISGCIVKKTDEEGGSGGSVSLGALLPMSGELHAFGPDMKKGVGLAVEHVNSGGGVFGSDTEIHYADTETDPGVAVDRYGSMVKEKDIDGFVGAASSTVSSSLLSEAVKDEVMQVSSGSTSPEFAYQGFKDGYKYFGRTIPNDGLQARVMARILIKKEFIEADSAAFVYVDNEYGKGLANEASLMFDGEITSITPFDQDKVDIDSLVEKTYGDDPDAVVLIAYPHNGKEFVETVSDKGHKAGLVLSESLNTKKDFINPLGDKLNDAYFALPDPRESKGTRSFKKQVGDVDNVMTAARAYDAVMLQALAAEKEGEASGTAIAKNIRSVSMPPGKKVTAGEFGRARKILGDGKRINYDGASGTVNLNENLDPRTPFGIYKLKDGELEKKRHVPVI